MYDVGLLLITRRVVCESSSGVCGGPQVKGDGGWSEVYFKMLFYSVLL